MKNFKDVSSCRDGKLVITPLYSPLANKKAPPYQDMAESVKAKGRFKLVQISDDGEEKVCVDDPNTIVYNFRKQQSRLLAGLFTDDSGYDARYITRISLGPNGDDTQIALNSSGAGAVIGYGHPADVVSMSPLTVTYPSDGVVEFVGRLEKTEGNGKTFQEAGLEFGYPEPYLAAREVFEPMTKSDKWIWKISWTITIVTG